MNIDIDHCPINDLCYLILLLSAVMPMEFILDGEESVEQEGTVSLKGRFEVEDEDG